MNSQDEEWKSIDHALNYLSRADKLPHRVEGERVLLDHIPKNPRRILDLGTGDGRLLALLRVERANFQGVAIDYSDPMLDAASKRFEKDQLVHVVKHDLSTPLPRSLGQFDVVVSSFAIHHLEDIRKYDLYTEVFSFLTAGGIFCNLEHVASPTVNLHSAFLTAIDDTSDSEDKSNKLLDLDTQLKWLREIGFEEVDCYWKWLELALLIGIKPAR